jgi:hypothetical protein
MSSTATAVQASSADAKTVTIPETEYKFLKTLDNAVKIAIREDKPIMMDYYTSSLNGTAMIGQREGNEKMLVKSADEYTSTISKTFRSGNEYIVQTENSIYIVSGKAQKRRINATQMRSVDYEQL